MHELQKREVDRLPVGTRVKLRGAPGLGVGVVAELDVPKGTAVRVLVAWEGLDEGRPYTYEQWERPAELIAVRS